MELEQQARLIVEGARQHYEQQVAATQYEKNELLAKYTQRAEHHIAQLRESEAAETERIVAGLEQQCAALTAAMNRTADEHAGQWRDELVRLCTKGNG